MEHDEVLYRLHNLIQRLTNQIEEENLEQESKKREERIFYMPGSKAVN